MFNLEKFVDVAVRDDYTLTTTLEIVSAICSYNYYKKKDDVIMLAKAKRAVRLLCKLNSLSGFINKYIDLDSKKDILDIIDEFQKEWDENMSIPIVSFKGILKEELEAA